MNDPMRFCLSLVLAGGMTATLPAQDEPPPPTTEIAAIPTRSSEELDELLGPIALYPDDLVALILPAAAQPTDIVLAARYLEDDGDIEDVDKQPWDESVRAIAHFPDVVEWMNKNLGWTQDVGDAFLAQPADVMKSVQRLRAKAYAAGTLRDTKEQKVLVDGDVIRIVSAEENVIYVPRYRTEVVYVDRPVYYSEPWITFGIGWHIGSWHRWSCDWYGHRVWVFDHHDHWRYRHRHNYHVGIHFNWRHFDHGRAWCPPRHSHWRHHHRYRDRDRDWDHGRRHIHRPGPYVEDHSRRRHHRVDGDRDGDGRVTRLDNARRDGSSDHRRSRERTDTPNTNQFNPGDRRTRTRNNGDSDGSPRSRSNVVVNNPPTTTTTPSPSTNITTAPVTNSGDRNVRRAYTNGRGNEADRGDRRNSSRGSRGSESSTRSTPTAVATTPTPAAPAPTVTAPRPTTHVERPRTVDSNPRDYSPRARQERGGDSGGGRAARAYRSEAPSAPPPVAISNPRVSRSEPARATVTTSARSYNNTNSSNSSSNAPVARPAPASSGGGGGGGRSANAYRSDSGGSRNADGGGHGRHSGRGEGGKGNNNNGEGRGRGR